LPNIGDPARPKIERAFEIKIVKKEIEFFKNAGF